ncbi:unnamed protein product [Trichobilharzia szidati]|nr:unnamed protein product [Trichobilharzia szidati]
MKMCEKEVNIRQTLCDQIDGPYKGQLRAYFPKLGEPTSCNLICLYNSHSVPHSFTLPDGTPCYSQRDDICIQGKCWETGCDGILGSRLRFDRCRVCGGDNSTCEEVKGVFNGNAMTSPGVHLRGLITAVRIPRGVTNAFVRKVSDRSTPYSSDSYDDFMLLIFEELKTQIRRGETREPFAGAELYYSGSRSREEIVSITGRLNKDVNIVIRVENTHTTQSFPTVEYSYFVDKSQQNNSLYFVAEKEAQLAAERVNRRTGRSQNAFASFEESERLTSTQNTVASEVERHQAQQEKPQIYFVWRISELPVGCTTCAGNVTTHAECYPLVPKESDQSQFSEFDLCTPVADYLCSSVPRPPPVLRRCSDYCGVRWTAKPAPIAKSSNDAYEMQTSSCSARCGEGHQAVIYVCEEYIVPAGQKDKSKGTWRVAQLGEFVCQKAGLGSAPSQPAYIACQGSCYPVYWILSNWTKCTNSCGSGKRKRSLHCQDQIGQNWPLSECLTHSESSLNQSNAPRQAITTQSAIKMIEEYQEKSASVEYNLYIEESIDCFSLTDCRNDIVWFTSEWSECEPLDEKMKSACRLIDNDTDQQSSGNKIIGVHYRNVSCVILDSNEDYHPSLNEYIESEQLTAEYVIQGKKLNMEFCRKASILGELIEEPIDREACSQPTCYRWGLGQMTSCSVTCGTGIQHIKIPCERIQLKYESDNLIDKQIVLDGIDTVSSEKCLQSLQYIPRLSTDKMNSTVYVETIERQIHDKDAVPLKIDDINEPIVLPCEKDPCNLRVPAWRTTSWSSCSTSCGLGVKERQVMCVMETVDNRLNRVFSKQNSQLYTSIFIARRSDVEIVDAQKCHAALLPKPIEQETCLQAPCPIWITGDWQECQGVCEYGIQRRQVRCVIELGSSKKSSNNNSSNVETDDDALRLLLSNPDSTGLIRRSRSAKIMDVDQERCRNAGVKPIAERPCLITGRCPYWYKSEWSECSVTCGMGTRTRQVDCRFPNGTQVDMEPLTDSQIDSKDMNTFSNDSFLQTMETIRQINTARYKCHAPRPIDNIACKTRPCKRREVFWWSVTSSECRVNGCELGKRERIIKCINPRRGPVHDSVCNHLNKPLNWTVCELFKCKTFQWVTGPWSTCPETCASRMRYRQVKCVDDLGNEYSESLCPQNLRPNSWSICPNLCSDVPKSCRELKHRYPSADDGTYHLLIEHSLVYIYCADMETTNPSEYITLRQINYAGSSEFLQPYPNTNWCPAFNETISTFNTSENINQFQSNIDTIQEIPENLLTNMQVNVINCPNCPSVPNLASKTFYHKIRLDIYNLEIKIDDTRFSHTVGSSIMPYATAKDCFSSTVCPQGQFQIDLRGTGFHVSVKTHWSVSSNTDGISHIFRSHNGQVIRGHCGGKCTGCWPQPGLFLDLLTDQMSNQPVKLIKTP